MSLSKVQSLADFVAEVRRIREDWTIPEDKELWFRGERRDYGQTRLRPILYRPPRHRALKSIGDLLKIEDDLFDAFQRQNVPLADTVIEEDFDGYLLMQPCALSHLQFSRLYLQDQARAGDLWPLPAVRRNVIVPRLMPVVPLGSGVNSPSQPLRAPTPGSLERPNSPPAPLVRNANPFGTSAAERN